MALIDRLLTVYEPTVTSVVISDTLKYPHASIGTACVLGGSFAGLLSARVLADHAERVLVIERDPLGDAPSVRPSI